MENKPIRVLQMTASLYHGGSQNMIINLYKAIDRDKVQFDFIVDHPELNDLQTTVEELGAKVYVMPKFKGTNISEIKKAWNDFFIQHPEYKIIHSHSRSYASIYLDIANKHGLKTIIHSHNTSNGSGIKAKIKDLFQYSLKKIADYFFACSYNAGKWLFGEEIVKSDKFFIVNNSIDTNKFRFNQEIRDKYRKELNLENNKVYIQVGEFNEQKNHKFTIELFNELIKTENNAKLLLVGTGEKLEETKKLVDKYQLKNEILFLGRRDDVNNLLMASDVYLMPSNFEGLSVAAIEAQASGIKCLLSDRASKDVNITNECIFLPLEIDKWINACKNEKYDRKDTGEIIKKMGFDVNSTAKWLEDFYLDIIK